MKLYKNTVTNLLWKTLNSLMQLEELKSFRLVGGTSLSLLLGHRMSVDIDMFTDAEYGSIDFDIIDDLFTKHFGYVEMGYGGNNSMGKTYFIGDQENEIVKVDLFYTDKFVFPMIKYNGIRLSKLEEITAMKLEIIGHNGRKKDFWDLHELMESFTLSEMLEFYVKRYPYSYTKDEIIKKLTDFTVADEDFEPICLLNKYWELIKIDFKEKVEKEFQ